MSKSIGDRNLLLGILALQKNFISEAALLAALKVWVVDKSKGLAQILRDQNALTENHHALLEEKVDNHLARHGNDAAKSLAAVCLVGSIRHDLEQIADPDVQASLASVSTTLPVPYNKPPVAETPAPMNPPMVVMPVTTEKNAPPKPPVKDKPRRVPAWALVAAGSAVGVVVAVVLLAGLVMMILSRDDTPIVQEKPDDNVPLVQKNPEDDEAKKVKKTPIKDPSLLDEKKSPIEADSPKVIDRKPTDIVGEADWWIESNELVVNNPTPKRVYLYFGSKTWTDYDFSFETSSAARLTGTLALFRATDPSDHYGLSLGAVLRTRHVLSRVEKGDLTYEEPQFKTTYNLNQWYKVRIEARGNQMRGYVARRGKVVPRPETCKFKLPTLVPPWTAR